MPLPVSDFPVHELSTAERLSLLGKIWDSLLDDGPPPVPEWHLAEIRRRIAEAKTTPTDSISLEEFRRQLRDDRS